MFTFPLLVRLRLRMLKFPFTRMLAFAFTFAFDFWLNVPGSHSLHRLSLTFWGSASYVPGVHGVFTLQYDCPATVWYLPTGQWVQIGALVLFEK